METQIDTCAITRIRTSPEYVAVTRRDATAQFDATAIIMYNVAIHNGDVMKATVVDLRYRMNDVLKALERNEPVTVLYHGKAKGTLSAEPARARTKVCDHPYFNMAPDSPDVSEQMNALRGGRHRAL